MVGKIDLMCCTMPTPRYMCVIVFCCFVVVGCFGLLYYCVGVLCYARYVRMLYSVLYGGVKLLYVVCIVVACMLCIVYVMCVLCKCIV